MTTRTTSNWMLGLGACALALGAIGVGLTRNGLIARRALGGFSALIGAGGGSLVAGCCLRRQVRVIGPQQVMPAEVRAAKQRSIDTIRGELVVVADQAQQNRDSLPQVFQNSNPHLGIARNPLPDMRLPFEQLVPAAAQWLANDRIENRRFDNEGALSYRMQQAYDRMHEALALEIELTADQCRGLRLDWRAPTTTAVAHVNAYRAALPDNSPHREPATRLVALLEAQQIEQTLAARQARGTSEYLYATATAFSANIIDHLQELHGRYGREATPLQGDRPEHPPRLQFVLHRYLVPMAQWLTSRDAASRASTLPVNNDRVVYNQMTQLVDLETLRLNLELGSPIDLGVTVADQLRTAEALNHLDRERLTRLRTYLAARAEARQIYP